MFVNDLLALVTLSQQHDPEPEPVVDDTPPPDPDEPAPPMWRAGDDPPPPPADDPPPDPGLLSDPPPDDPADPPADPPPDDDTSRLAERDAELVERERSVAARERQFQAFVQAQELAAQGKTSEAARMLGIDPQAMLREQFGTDLFPNEQPTTEQQLEQQQQLLQSTQQQLQSTQEQIARLDLRREAADALDPEQFPIQALRAKRGRQTYYNMVIDRGLDMMKKNGIFPDWDTLYKAAEGDEFERYCKDANELLQIKGVREKLGVDFVRSQGASPKPAAPPPAQRRQAAPAEPPAPSLTNAMNSQPPLESELKNMSREERRAAAIKMLRDSRLKQEAAEAAKNK